MGNTDKNTPSYQDLYMLTTLSILQMPTMTCQNYYSPAICWAFGESHGNFFRQPGNPIIIGMFSDFSEPISGYGR